MTIETMDLTNTVKNRSNYFQVEAKRRIEVVVETTQINKHHRLKFEGELYRCFNLKYRYSYMCLVLVVNILKIIFLFQKVNATV